jgi:hypothetical protein
MMERDYNTYFINLEKIQEYPNILAVTKLLAIRLQNNPYMKIGNFLKNLSDADLKTLLDIEENDSQMEDILMMSFLLARAEGVENGTVGLITLHTNMFQNFITAESLYRKGLIELYHDNLSFGEEAGDKVIARPKL